MVLDWFDAREAVRFAEEITKEVERVISVTSQGGGQYAGKKDKRRFDALITRVNTFARQHPLNIYKKAKFLNAIKWKLKDSGQDELLIKEVVALLTVALNA